MGCIKLLFLGLMSLEPLPVSFPQASPPCCSYSSLLSATASHSFARAVWHVGLQQWSPSHPCSCLTNFQIPYRDCMSRRLENRSIFFSSLLLLPPPWSKQLELNLSLGRENLISWYWCSASICEAFCLEEFEPLLRWKS